jgi:hypothetical protein
MGLNYKIFNYALKINPNRNYTPKHAIIPPNTMDKHDRFPNATKNATMQFKVKYSTDTENLTQASQTEPQD